MSCGSGKSGFYHSLESGVWRDWLPLALRYRECLTVLNWKTRGWKGWVTCSGQPVLRHGALILEVGSVGRSPVRN